MPRTSSLDPADVFTALSDRTRLRLLNLLREGERCVCDLVEGVEAPQPTISRHLAVLRRSGLVESRKDGLWMHYRLARGSADLLEGIFACLARSAALDPGFARDEKRTRAARAGRGCCD